MCGIAGFLSAAGRADGELRGIAERMALAIAHRGPDDAGTWADPQDGVALGFRRLSIVDLSPAGHQPMPSAQGRFVIVFNGEIYNHASLRADLEAAGAAPAWRGHSDTEVLLAAIEHWGLEAALGRTVGMFAIALWDRREHTLHLARDRFGEKPLYYGWAGEGPMRALVFGSELKALRAFPAFANPVCREALAQYMRFTYVPAPRSIYQGIYKLEPGCMLSIRGVAPATAPARPMRPPAVYENLTWRRWWSLAQVVESGAASQFKNEDEAVNLLEQRLAEAVRLQSLADVPLGAFLSGGVDSSTIVALMQQQTTQRVRTFTVGFQEVGFDESPYARAVAKHLETDHTEIFVAAAQAQAVIAKLPAIYDEPFADSSQVSTHVVCAAARSHVTVALSGDGGDEMFGGYNRYFWGPEIWSRVNWLPHRVRQAMGAAILAVPQGGWDALARPFNALLGGSRGVIRLGEKAHKLAGSIGHVHDADDLYLSLVSEWQDPADVVIAESNHPRVLPSVLSDDVPATGVQETALRMMYRDSMTYLPDDILCKVDRAAMAVGLETRVPFLDHRVAEAAWQLPLNMRIRGRQGKWALRQILDRYVPSELIDRPKAGFALPLGQWLRGPLRPWCESLLAQTRLQAEGYFHPEPIRRKWAEHLNGSRDHTASLWAVLMFQAWLESAA